MYKIGEAAHRTGISVERLRAWERRYGLKPAKRTGTNRARFYSDAQITQLKRIKLLLDQGHPIGRVVRYSDAELARLVKPIQGGRAIPHIGIVGAPLILAHKDEEQSDCKIISTWVSSHEFETTKAPNPLDGIDVLIIYLPSLDPPLIEKYRRLAGDASLLVVYRYAAQRDLDSIRTVCVVRWPIAWSEIEQYVHRLCGLAPTTESGERRFSDGELAHIMTLREEYDGISPAHVAELVGQLNDFSAHAHRHTDAREWDGMAGHVEDARTHLEQALTLLVEEYGLLERSN